MPSFRILKWLQMDILDLVLIELLSNHVCHFDGKPHPFLFAIYLFSSALRIGPPRLHFKLRNPGVQKSTETCLEIPIPPSSTGIIAMDSISFSFTRPPRLLLLNCVLIPTSNLSFNSHSSKNRNSSFVVRTRFSSL